MLPFVTGEAGRETAELVTTLNTWKKDRAKASRFHQKGALGLGENIDKMI